MWSEDILVKMRVGGEGGLPIEGGVSTAINSASRSFMFIFHLNPFDTRIVISIQISAQCCL